MENSVQKKFYNLTITIVIILFLIFSIAAFISFNENYTAHAYGNQDIIIDGFDFADNSVLVTLDKNVGGVNKKHDKNYFGDIAVTDITDLTYRENIANVNLDSFCQILKLELQYHDKNYVLQAVEKIGKIKGVKSVSPNYYGEFCATATDPYYNKQWGLWDKSGINIESAWNITSVAKSVRVGVIDSGIYSYPEFTGNVIMGRSFTTDTSTEDRYGHGTHVAGIIGAKADNGFGISGVCKNVDIVPLKISNDNTWPTDNAIAAITHANNLWGTNNQIDILNFSGGGFPNNENLYNAIKTFPGLFVTTAGNGKEDAFGVRKPFDIDDESYYPGGFDCDNIITVGSIDSNGSKSKFSNYGKLNVDLFAPGENILSSYPQSLCTGKKVKTSDGVEHEACECEWDPYKAEWKLNGRTHYEKGYHYMSGTSMAAPHVTGVAALLLSMDKSLTAAELKTIICNNVDKSEKLTDLCVTGGRLNAFKAIESIAYKTNSTGETIIGINSLTCLELDVPESINGVTITGIGENAITNCKNLKKVILPDTVTYIGRGAFAGCTALTDFNLPSDTMQIVNGAFDNTAWYNSQPNGLVFIGKSLYSYKGYMPSNTIINNIPSNISQISAEAFKDCADLTEIIIPASINKIGSLAFSNCSSLEKVFVNNTIQLENADAFSGCGKLRYIIFNDIDLLNKYKSDSVWMRLSSKFYCLKPVPQTEWMLITDVSESDAKLLSLTSFYNIKNLYAKASSYQIEDIVNANLNSSFIIYEGNTKLLTVQLTETIKSMRMEGVIGQVLYISDNSVQILDKNIEDIPVKADTYSLGVKIGTEYFKNNNTPVGNNIYKNLKYFPVIAAEKYKEDILFLMGLSGVVNYPVKIFSNVQELEQVMSVMPSIFMGYSWLYVDIGIYEFEKFATFFKEHGAISGVPMVFSHESYVRPDIEQYIIYDKVDRYNVIAKYVNWSEYGGSEPNYHEYTYDAAQYWNQNNLLPTNNKYNWFDSWVTFWNNEKYGINVNEWMYYWTAYSVMAGYSNPYNIPLSNIYWANFHICLVEQCIGKE